MEHGEAVQQKAAERYLLNELSPEARDAFEGHFFDCRECALDLRAAAAFIDEAKAQLPALQTQARPAVSQERRTWFAWASPLFTPAFAAPAFAALLLVVGYQNAVTLPGLRAAATQPHLVALDVLHTGVRGDEVKTIAADRKLGATLPFDLPRQGYASYALTLVDPAGKQVLATTVAAPGENDDKQLGLDLPGAGLTAGKYTLVISGVDAKNAATEISRTAFEIQLPQ